MSEPNIPIPTSIRSARMLTIDPLDKLSYLQMRYDIGRRGHYYDLSGSSVSLSADRKTVDIGAATLVTSNNGVNG